MAPQISFESTLFLIHLSCLVSLVRWFFSLDLSAAFPAFFEAQNYQFHMSNPRLRALKAPLFCSSNSQETLVTLSWSASVLSLASQLRPATVLTPVLWAW
jgi:hypothetical protein